MDVILDLGISCTSTSNQQPATRSTKGSTQAFTAPHGSQMAPEEARSEAGTCFPTWMTTSSRFEAKPKGHNPLELGDNIYINRNMISSSSMVHDEFMYHVPDLKYQLHEPFFHHLSITPDHCLDSEAWEILGFHSDVQTFHREK